MPSGISFDKAFTDAMSDAILHGHGFLRITNNDGLKAYRIKPSEFDSIKELFDWIKNNRVEIDNETPQQKGGDEEQTASKS
jgi:PHD/YefM family antitoxin component YafN of YafNO toxin-antitoxin module